MTPDELDPDGRFRAEVAASLAADPMPAFRGLAARLGVPVGDLVHYALHRWASAGSEALLAGPPEALAALRDAAADGDLERVRGIVGFLMAGYDDGGAT